MAVEPGGDKAATGDGKRETAAEPVIAGGDKAAAEPFSGGGKAAAGPNRVHVSLMPRTHAHDWNRSHRLIVQRIQGFAWPQMALAHVRVSTRPNHPDIHRSCPARQPKRAMELSPP